MVHKFLRQSYDLTLLQLPLPFGNYLRAAQVKCTKNNRIESFLNGVGVDMDVLSNTKSAYEAKLRKTRLRLPGKLSHRGLRLPSLHFSVTDLTPMIEFKVTCTTGEKSSLP